MFMCAAHKSHVSLQSHVTGMCLYNLLGIRMRMMPRARCIQYICNGKTQNVLFFVDNDMNEIIIVIIILPGPLTLLFCLLFWLLAY